VEELVPRVVVQLIHNGVALFCANEHFERQPEGCIIAVNAKLDHRLADLQEKKLHQSKLRRTFPGMVRGTADPSLRSG
jgi:hypothetical protein